MLCFAGSRARLHYRPDLSSITQFFLDETEICTVLKYAQSPLGLLGGKEVSWPLGLGFFCFLFHSCLPLSAVLQVPGSLLSFICPACPASLLAEMPLSYAHVLPLEGQSPFSSKRLRVTQHARARNPQSPSPAINHGPWLERSVL